MAKMKKKRFLKWFNNQKLWKKILFAFIISSIIPLMAVQTIMIYVNSVNMEEKVDELMVSQLTQIAERANLTLDVYTNLVYQAYVDNQLIENVCKMMDSDNAEKEVAYREIYERIQQYGTSAEGIVCVSIIARDGQQITYDFRNASTVQNIWEDYEDIRKISPFERAQGAAGVVITPTMRFIRNGEEERIFHLSKKMFDYKELDKGTIGTIVMSVDEKVLNEICVSNTEGNPEEDYSINFIIDEEGYVLSYPEPDYSGIPTNPELAIEEFVKMTGQLKAKDIAVNVYEDKSLGWKFYNAYDRDYMLKDVYETQKFTLIFGILIMILSILMILYTIRLIEQSIQTITEGIQEVQKGNLDVKVEIDSEDEFGKIAENFNTMTGKVQNLITEVTEVTQKQKEAEIRALEAQINPHFLYNTLDSINWMAIDKGEYEISKMLRDLGVILRYSVNKSNQMVQIREAVDWLEKYVSLQQVRFNHSFSFAISVDKEVEKIRIYKLLLQPFVENAIVHGFKGIEKGGMIRIDIMQSEDQEKVLIIIEDNGKGMPKEVVQKYNQKDFVDEEENSIGLSNAFSRLKIYYGGKEDWNISSIKGVGTVITLRLPIKEGEI